MGDLIQRIHLLQAQLLTAAQESQWERLEALDEDVHAVVAELAVHVESCAVPVRSALTQLLTAHQQAMSVIKAHQVDTTKQLDQLQSSSRAIKKYLS